MSDAAPAERNSNDGPVELADDAWCAEKPITTGTWPVVTTKRAGTFAGFKHYGSRRGWTRSHGLGVGVDPLDTESESIVGVDRIESIGALESMESSDSEKTLAIEDEWIGTPEADGMLAIEDDPTSVSMLDELLKAVTTYKNYYRPMQIIERDRIRRRTWRLQQLNKRPNIEGDRETRRNATLPNEVYESREDKPNENATHAELVLRCAMFYLRAEWSQLTNEDILDMIEYVQGIAPKFRTLHERVTTYTAMKNNDVTAYTDINRGSAQQRAPPNIQHARWVNSYHIEFWTETAFQIGLYVGYVDNDGAYVRPETDDGPVAVVQSYVGNVLDRVQSGIGEPLDGGSTIGTVIDQLRIDEFLAFCRNVSLV